ncbi:E3 ubiquitin-protein ligase TRIM21-like isoform 1-T3 [Aulostomus maculatus]
MALPAVFLSEDQFTCSICLEVFTNPVSIPCGHSFCQACISSYWDGGGSAKVYQCPLCKETFGHRQELHINRTLKEITEQFKKIATPRVAMDGRVGGGMENANLHPNHQHHLALSPGLRGPGEMPESIFAEMMSRFQQLPTPGMRHDPPPPYSPPRRYTLNSPSDASPSLPLCPIHLRGREFFCQTDNSCVCKICVEKGEHHGHNIIPAKREWNIKRSQLGIAQMELKDLICEKEKKVEEIHSSLQDIKTAAERETDGAVHVFHKLMSCVEHCQAEVLEVIEMTRREAEHRAQSLLRDLEDEITELKKRSTALSQLALSEDYVLFLQNFTTLSTPPQMDRSTVSVSSVLTTGIILRTVSHMIEHFQEEMQKLPDVCNHSSLDQSVPRPNQKIKRVQEYAANITLDPNTAHPRLIISEDGKKVYCGDRHQPLPDNPERFDRVVCVLAHQGFSSGRHYWEVEVGRKTDWDLGVASRSVRRKGKITVSPSLGYWFLSLRDRTDYAFRTDPSTSLTLNFRPSRVGIYVDCDKGLVSFYNVEDRVLIYTFTDSFSDTIHPFFSPCTNKSGNNEAPLIICPVEITKNK